MGLTNVLTLSQIAGHVIAFILSICVTIPMLVHVRQFDGHCLLFTTGQWQEDDGLFKAEWASKGYCNFPIVIGFILCITSLTQIYRLSLIIRNEIESSFFGLFMDVFIAINLCAIVLVAAVMITLGFIVWCSDMTQRFPSCDTADGQNITNTNITNINTNGFYIEMGTAQFGAWGSFATWVGLSMFALLKLINNHQVTNMRVSMYLERQRLVNDGVYSDSLTEPPAASLMGGGGLNDE